MNELINAIWNKQEDLPARILTKTDFQRLIPPFLFLRRLDCLLEAHKNKIVELHNEYKDKEENFSEIVLKEADLTIYNTSQYTLNDLRQNGENLVEKFDAYIEGFDKTVKQVFRNMLSKNMSDSLKREEALMLLINIFSEIDLSVKLIDNITMSKIYDEFVQRNFVSFHKNKLDHLDIIKLQTQLLFSSNDNFNKKKELNIFSPSLRNNNVLIFIKEWIRENMPNNNASITFWGENENKEQYGINSGKTILLGNMPQSIKEFFNSHSRNDLSGKEFDYILSPPSFKMMSRYSTQQDEKIIERSDTVPKHDIRLNNSLYRLKALIENMNKKESKMVIVLNEFNHFSYEALMQKHFSRRFNEDDIRKWIIESDYLECIISLPDELFKEYEISNYIWVLTTKKPQKRKGKIQLIDGRNIQLSHKSGAVEKYIADDQLKKLVNVYQAMTQNEYSKVFPNKFFGYTKVRINYQDKNNRTEYEKIPLTENIDEYFEQKIKPFLPYSILKRGGEQVGYEINFKQYFYKHIPERSVKEIAEELLSMEKNNNDLLNDILKEWILG